MLKAVIYAPEPPSEHQKQKIEEFIKSRYEQDIELCFVADKKATGGFRLEVGHDVYDYTLWGRLHQLKAHISSLPLSEDIIPLIKGTAKNWAPKVIAEEIGTVLSVCDGVAVVEGLQKATYGEILVFGHDVYGMVQNLTENTASCILFDGDEKIYAGSRVRRTGRVAGIPVGEGFLGRVVNALGEAIDGKKEIEADDYRRVESPAPAIIDRAPVKRPLETGILTIDSMFPIGKGQRELIIGDRQTGKTAIALDTILNQKGKDVKCVYVAIGQKASSVAQIVNTLKQNGALEYTAIVCAGASDSAALQFIAPFAGCALAEYFMEKGEDVLIIYDDLSKHAVAYRALSLLLGRSPGREAYPGDVFYLHSRLLERSAQLSDEKGGGSITALPIVETQAGDVAAYIPTNIISITDGQIFLESDLFFAGQRPAVNIGISVSRVGRDAQTSAMKKAGGSLRLSLAQYREMKIFTQFSSDLESSVKARIEYGERLMQVLRQDRYSPYSLSEQVILLIAATKNLFKDTEILKVTESAARLLEYFTKNQAALCQKIDTTGELIDSDILQIEQICKEFLCQA